MMKKIESYNKVFKGKSASTSVPLISMRYNAEDEELEQLVENHPDAGVMEATSLSCTESPLMEKKVKDKDTSAVLPKLSKRSGSLEDPTPGETWKFFSEMKVRIAKTVEEKIEEIKSERIKKKERKKKLTTGGENSSISDSEDRSEPSSSRQSPVKSESLKESEGESSDLSTSSLGRKNSVDVTEIDISDTTPVKEEAGSFKKGVMSSIRKHDKTRHKRHKRRKRESVEVAEEAVEEASESSISVKQIENIKLIGKVNSWWISFFIVILASSAKFSLLPVEWIWLGLGMVIAVLFRWIYDWLSKSDVPEPEKTLFNGRFDLQSMPIMAEKMESVRNANPEHTAYEGWINEYEGKYNPESYKVSLTQTVHIRLEGCKLILSTPRNKVPKRASWNEPEYSKDFLRESTYNINGCSVSLLPEGLTRKRLWSKKYPIYIELLPNSYFGTLYKDKDEYDNRHSNPVNPPSTDPQASDNEKTDVASDVINDDRKDDDGDNTQEDTDGMPEEEVFNEQVSAKLETAIENKETSNGDEVFDESDFVHVSSSLVGKKSSLVLFTRSDREKELWFRRLVAAVGYFHFDDKTDDLNTVIGESLDDLRLQRSTLNNSYLDFMKTLAQVLPKSMKKPKWKSKESHSGSMWFNVFVSRIFFDTYNDSFWMAKIQDKVQRKLATVRLPSVIEELVVSKLEFQGPSPMVESWSEPRIDDQGIWADLGISYKGQFLMTIDIKLNLVKKRTNQSEIELNQLSSPEHSKPESKSAIYNSSIEDSGESSSEELEKPKVVDTPSPNSPQKHQNFVEKIASSKYFLQVADNRYVKKALEGVSNTHISLTVELKGLVGTVVINIPPPPSDRLWYGFRPKPKLWLSARPVVGERVLKIINITKWIEKRLYKEFEKILVMPNMDDLVIPVMDKTLPF